MKLKNTVSAFTIALGLGLVVYEATTGFGNLFPSNRLFFSEATQDEVQGAEETLNFSSMEEFLEWASQNRPNPRSTVAGHYLAGRFASSINDLDQAAIEINSALNIEPEDEFLIGRAFPGMLAAGEVEDALELAYSIDSSHPFVSMLASSLQLADAFKVADFDTAQALIDNMRTASFGEYIKPLSQAWLDVAMGEGKNAIQSIQKRMSTQPQMSILYDMHLAFIHDYLGNKKEASKYYLRVFEQHKSIRTGWLAARFLTMNGNKEKAIEILKSIDAESYQSTFAPYAIQKIEEFSAQKDSNRKPYIETPADGLMAGLFDLASVLDQEGSKRLALMYARIAEYIDVSDPFVALLIGDIQRDTGLNEEALNYYANFKKESAFYIMTTMRQAELLDELGRQEEAIRILNKIADIEGVQEKVQMTLGDIHRRSSEFEKAVSYYTSVLEKSGGHTSEDWVIFYARGMALEQSGQWEKAEVDLIQALTLQPDQPYVLNYLGYSWSDKGVNTEKALEYIKKAIMQRPFDGYIVDSMGWALHRLGRDEEAVKYLERATQLVPNDPVVNDHLGDVYWRVGRRIEARYQWQRAIKVADDPEMISSIENKIIDGLGAKSYEVKNYAENQNTD